MQHLRMSNKKEGQKEKSQKESQEEKIAVPNRLLLTDFNFKAPASLTYAFQTRPQTVSREYVILYFLILITVETLI